MIESFWEKDVQLHYDVRVAVGLIGGQALKKSLGEMESIRQYCKLPASDKPANYYIARYAEYSKKKDGAENLLDAKNIIASVIEGDFIRDPEVFYVSLQKAIKADHGEYLAIRTISALRNMQVFKARGVDAGFALTSKKGSAELEIVSLFNQSRIPGLGTKLTIAAIELGGRSLECFGPYLNDYYGSHGFKPHKKINSVKMRNGSYQTLYRMNYVTL